MRNDDCSSVAKSMLLLYIALCVYYEGGVVSILLPELRNCELRMEESPMTLENVPVINKK